MAKELRSTANDVMLGVGLIRQEMPDVMKAFGALSSAATLTLAAC
jgi:hypothetical protein